MHLSMRKIVKTAKTCKKAIWTCMKNVRRKLFVSKRSEKTEDVINTVTEVSTNMQQEASCSATIDLPEETVIVSSVNQEIVQTSVDHDHTLDVVYNEKLQNKTRTKRIRRKRVTPESEKRLLIKTVVVDDIPQNTDHDLHAAECGHVTENCRENKDQAIVVSEQPDEAGDVEFCRTVEKVRKQRAGSSHKVPCDKEKQNVNKINRTSLKLSEISVSLRCEEQNDRENMPTDASCENPTLTELSERSSSRHKKKAKRSPPKKLNLEAEKLLSVSVDMSDAATRNPATDISYSNDDQETCKNCEVIVVSEQAENAGEVSQLWSTVVKTQKQRVDQSGNVPCSKEQLCINKPEQIKPSHIGKSLSTRYGRKTAYEKKSTDKQCSSLRELNNNIKLILNTITMENLTVLSKDFAALPIDTIERLDNTVDLVFEKAIRKQIVAHLCAVLCTAMQSINVTCANSKKTTSFQSQILRKCQSTFEADKANRTESAKKLAEIKACKNLKKKKELQFSYDENEERWRKRSVGNCRFIGELFNQRILRISILQYCIENLASQRTDSALECLCSLLKTIAKESEQCENLNKTLDMLKDLTSDLSISSRTRKMIQEVIDLWKKPIANQSFKQ